MSVLVDAAKVQVIGYIEDAKDNVSSLSALTQKRMDQAKHGPRSPALTT